MTLTFANREKKSNPRPDSKEAPIVEKIKHVEIYHSLDNSLKKNWSDMRVKAIKRRISPMTFLIHSK
jgi:ubiquitin-like 1-activating enzyme E1 A